MARKDYASHADRAGRLADAANPVSMIVDAYQPARFNRCTTRPVDELWSDPDAFDPGLSRKRESCWTADAVGVKAVQFDSSAGRLISEMIEKLRVSVAGRAKLSMSPVVRTSGPGTVFNEVRPQ
ncbi:hypothetical protein [Nocardia tenerifensis]|uniref:hypothetical protein n=1 Tax=Nocardia tenerifensis TaxID=228006 RepID=UPI0012F6D0BD|nr:hypothetical protein [Nocardia tenerifensis]